MSQLLATEDFDVPEPMQAPEVFERDYSEYMSLEDTGLKPEDLPEPTLWRVLILPKQPKRMSKGGIALPGSAVDAEIHLNYVGQVLKLGPLAGKSEKFENPDFRAVNDGTASDPKMYESIPPRFLWNVKPGDWVIFGRYSGQVVTYKDVRLLTVNDDEIVQVIKSPDGYKVYV